MKNNSYSKQNRIPNRLDFKKTMSTGFVLKKKGFSIFFAKSKNHTPRLGISVAKRNVKKSVQRSFLKRLVRESFRLHKRSLLGLDVVVLVKREFADSKLFFELNSIFENFENKFGAKLCA